MTTMELNARKMDLVEVNKKTENVLKKMKWTILK